MVSASVEGCENDEMTKVDPKKSEVSCWNCFTTVAAESAPDPEPATLPKIRQETRQKYRLYSFIASQLSKPKAVPLAQKVSENYAIGKKVEKRITEKAVQTSISQIEKVKNDSAAFDKLDNSVESGGDIPELEEPVSEKNSEDEKEKKIKDYIREYNLFEAYKSIRRKAPTPNTSFRISKDNITLEKSNVSSNSNSFTDLHSPNYKKLEIVQPKVTIRKVYESPSISITSNTYITKSQENLEVLDSNKTLSQTTSLNKEEPITPSSTLSQKSTTNKQNEIVQNSLPHESTSTPRRISSSNSSLNRSQPSLTSLRDSPKSQHFIAKSLKIENVNKDHRKSSPVLNMPLISPRKLTPTKSTENILHKVQIDTSTPKTENKSNIKVLPSPDSTDNEKVIRKQADLDQIIEGIQNISLENKEQAKSDKIDNASLNESESGYSGSSTRDLHDPDIAIKNIASNRLSIESGNETESPQSSHRIPRLNFKSSLPALVSRHKDMSISTKSLASGSTSEDNKPVKKLRWSTLGLPRSSTDEVYLSESVSPGHATLPRRSNSPLPHERDMLDRDRFSLNRSGLQNRSESMASVYSGAGEGTRCNVAVRGEVQFSLLYNYRLGALEVGVKRCRDLAPVDTKRNRSDPYVKVYLLPDKSKAGKRKTKVKKNTLNPVFEETLAFSQPLASLSARTLWLSAWHADMFGRNDFLGEVTLPLADVVFDDPAPMWYKLHERTEQFDEAQGTRGDLIVGLKFEAAEGARGKGTLHVLVKEAKNLVATKPSGLADVFCKSYLLPDRGKLVKQKTSVVRRTLNPRWEQTFTYRGLKMQELSTRALELSLWDRDRLASNDFMGAVRLSLGTGTYMGSNVNWMDSAGKEVTLWQTMLERPNFWVEGSLPLRPQLSN